MLSFIALAFAIIIVSWFVKFSFHFIATVAFITLTLMSWNLHTPEGYVFGSISGLISFILLFNLLKD